MVRKCGCGAGGEARWSVPVEWPWAGESEESKSEAGVRELGREGHSRVAAEVERWVGGTRFSEDRRYT